MKPRKNKPQAGNKYYISTKDGGYNGAEGNPLRRNKDLTALPNCVAIYGWFNEVGENGMQYLKAPWYPWAVIDAAKREGLTVTVEPTVGGIMVWTGGRTGDGHVEGCVSFYEDGSILTASSEYYGRDWVNFHRYKGDGNWRDGCYWMDKSYTYRGCIKNPFVEEKPMTYEQFKDYMNRYLREIANAPADAWAVPAIEYCKDQGLMVGDESGNFKPQSPVRREELAAVIKGLTE